MEKKDTWHIHLQGQVQGVGFRPFIYHLAKIFFLDGWVNNNPDGVHVEFNATDFNAHKFYEEILKSAPQLSHITSHSIKQIVYTAHENFKIIQSNKNGDPVLNISPDFATCEDCRKEISDINNRRYNYAFTTCTQCGPRYSIIKQLPYDRENTSMEDFIMCSQCLAEYNNSENRRYYSQTNSCPHCAVKLELFDNNKNIIEDDQQNIFFKICDILDAGKIVAIKAIGGYLLTCNARNISAIKELRKRKQRPAKPFALMFPDISGLETEVFINNEEKKELKGSAAPIVLLQLKQHSKSKLALTEIAPGLSRIGVMLAYNPFFLLLLKVYKKPIIATSGNISAAPIVYEDEIAMHKFSTIADFILVHNRKIIAAQDDSVVNYSRYYKQRIVLRGARGFAPFYINQSLKTSSKTILALGAMMKSGFTLLDQGTIHISQYLGDSGDYDTAQNFEKAVLDFLTLFKTKPELIIADKHPDYFSTHLAEILSAKWKIPLIKIQHHEAHFASVLAEHNLNHDREPILGVVWDGTGYGDDGQIWGGEFFMYHQYTFLRINHFDYFHHFLGDKMPIEPRLAAFSICHALKEAEQILNPKFSVTEWKNYNHFIKKNKLQSSSIGRLFDAVASVLGLIDKSSFEGEAAMLLEEKAIQYFKSGFEIPVSWLEENLSENLLSPEYLMLQTINKITQGKDKPEIAAWFHVQLVISIQKIAFKNKCRKICLSGGVFQNGLLVDLTVKILGEKYALYFNKDLSPNDENISFGQLIWFAISEKYAL